MSIVDVSGNLAPDSMNVSYGYLIGNIQRRVCGGQLEKSAPCSLRVDN